MKHPISSEFRKVVLFNYLIPAEVVQHYLPKHTKLDLYNGNCYISLVGFEVTKFKISETKIPVNIPFEEIDLQIYVKRFDGAQWRKGVVVISRIFNLPLAAHFANTIWGTNITPLPTNLKYSEDETSLRVQYSWEFKGEEQHFMVESDNIAAPYEKGTEAAFVLDRDLGFLKISDEETYQYKTHHAQWHLYSVEEYSIDVDFSRQFSSALNILNGMTPHSVILTEGSTVEITDFRSISS